MPIELVDHLGRPVKKAQLTDEIATPQLSGVRTVWQDSVANTLTPEALATILLGVDQGDIVDYLTLAEEMEERDLHYHSVLGTRKMALSGLEIAVEAPTDDAADVKAAEFVADVFKADAFENLVSDALDALGKGFSVCEIMWEKGAKWVPKEYIWRDPRFFMFDKETGSELRLRDVEDQANGIELAPYKFITHYPKLKTGLPIRGGLARLAAVAYLCKSYTITDWLAFIEVFGMPIRVGKYPAGSDAAQKSALLQAVSRIGIDASCIIPDSMMIEFIDGVRSRGGDVLFEGAADWWDSQVSKGVLGQTMTSDDGASLAQAKVHNEVRGDILEHDMRQLASTLRRDLVKPLVDLNLGPREETKYPKVRFVNDEPEDLEALSRSLPPFIKMGLRVEESVILDKFGLEQPADDAVLLKAPKIDPEAEDRPGQNLPPPQPGQPPQPEPAPEPTAEPPANDDKPKKQAARKLDELAKAALTAKVLNGETLTEDQRRLLMLLADDDDDDDLLDEEADKALAEWEKVMDPLLQPILNHAQASTDYQEFLDGLQGVAFDDDSQIVRLTLSKRVDRQLPGVWVRIEEA